MTAVPSVDSDEDERFIVKFSSWEGPIEALLDLARSQKLDLANIDILDLVGQFEVVVGKAMSLRLELAADWLVMASWLTYLKSRILLRRPKDGKQEMDEDTLAYHLKRLDGVKRIAQALEGRLILGKDWFAPGGGHHDVVAGNRLSVSYREFLAAYPTPTAAQIPNEERKLKPFDLVSVDSAINRLSIHMPCDEWVDLITLVPKSKGLRLRSNIATSLVGSLELSRNGTAEIRQDGFGEPIYVRRVSNV